MNPETRVLSVILLLLTVAGLTALIAAQTESSEAKAKPGEPELVDTCPQGTLLHNGDRYKAPGAVCVPGYIPTKREKSEDLYNEGRQAR